MAQVFVTQTGTRYHAATDAKCMENAQGHATVDLATAVAGGLLPCLTCGAPPLPDSSEGDHRWLRAIDDWQRAGLFESMYEQAFARRVLAKCSGLGPDSVEVQSYIPAGGESFKVDFFVPTSGLVLEVDGYSKDGFPPTPTDLEKRNRRDGALQSRGLKVLHFSNAQVQQEPNACLEQVRAALATPSSINSAAESRTNLASPSVVAAPTVAQPAFQSSSATKFSRAGLWIAIGIVGLVAIIGVVFAASKGSNDSTAGGSTSIEPVAVPAQEEVPAAAPATVVVPSAGLPPENGTCPAQAPFKANENDEGEKIVHSPGQQFYSKVNPEQCYARLDDAIAAGFRASQR